MEGPVRRGSLASVHCAPPQPSAAPGSTKAAARGRRERLALRLGLGLLLVLLLHAGARHVELGDRLSFVGGPPASAGLKLRTASPTAAAAAGESGEGSSAPETEEALRQRVAQLELKLAEKLLAPKPAAAPGAEPPEDAQPSPVKLLIDAAVKEVPEIEEIESARLGMTDDKTYVFQKGDSSVKKSIYRRKYEVMGMVMTQQEAFAKASRRAQKKAESSQAIKDLIDLKRNGGSGMSRKEVKKEIARLEGSDRIAAIIFNNIIPKLEENPLGDAIGAIAATLVLLLVFALLTLCVIPPMPSGEE